MASKKKLYPFNKKLVLNSYMLHLFGMKHFDELALSVDRPEHEGITEDGISNFHYAVLRALPFNNTYLNREMLLGYDQNIVKYTREIQQKRERPIHWKYFQYLALLFTEIYLDKYITNPNTFIESLNVYREEFNRENNFSIKESITPFTKEDLNKIAFWCATGSGKTLLMHMNIKQYIYYIQRAKKENTLNRILLITPNEGLSEQHKYEFALSNIRSHIFTKENQGGLISSSVHNIEVEILEITKLAEKSGEKTIAVEAFEGNNLVLVDEGHRGSSGDTWMKNRKAIAQYGFTFEYSATLGQAVSSNESLMQEYVKAILFDYSYRYFYNDGYGKEYRILNLAEDNETNIRERYLTACLLTFYQQQVLYSDPNSEAKRFQIENPLLIFVGGSVNAIRIENKRQVSDVVDIVLFLARVVSPENRKRVIENIEHCMSGKTGLLTTNGVDIFSNSFPYLVGKTAETVLEDIHKRLYNAQGGGKFYVEELKGSNGEIALRLGENIPFGVINVGDSTKLCKLCAEHKELIVVEKAFSESLFHGINRTDSKINILIGSKKFTEGWSSWRVSTMGLMNVGKKEGSEIIQLFGRGVRLKGYEHSLKRHKALQKENRATIEYNPKLLQLETLNIFGVRADYMAQFKTYLEEEGISTEEALEITIPVLSTLPKRELKIIGIKEGLNFRTSGEKPCLKQKDCIKNKEIIDYYPRIQAKEAKGIHKSKAENIKEEGHLTEEHIAFLDIEELFFELQDFKNERAWYNLNIYKENILAILKDNSWYTLLIPKEYLLFTSMNNIHLWQEIANSLVKKYCSRYYKYCKEAWEAPHREYTNLTKEHGNFFSEYSLRVDALEEQLLKQIKELQKTCEQGLLKNTTQRFAEGKAFFFDTHLYQPLLYIEGERIQAKPSVLNKGEAKFLEDIQSFYENNNTFFENKELFLLRNMSRGRGLGFFEAGNFYPDFIMWFFKENKQHIIFIDPKGIRNLDSSDPKILFYQEIKKVEKSLGDSHIILDSFILSVTPFSEVRQWESGMKKEDFRTKHVLFQEEKEYIKDIFICIRG